MAEKVGFEPTGIINYYGLTVRTISTIAYFSILNRAVREIWTLDFLNAPGALTNLAITAYTNGGSNRICIDVFCLQGRCSN